MNVDSPKRRRPARALRTQVREAVRAQILDAAEELISTRGLHGAALAQIAKRAGVAVGTLYNYFTDRDAMVRALFESRRATLRPQIRAGAAASDHLPFEPRLRHFTRALFEVFEAHRRFLKVAIETEHFKVTPSHTQSDMHAAIVAIVDAGVAEKQLAAERAPLLAQLFVGALKTVVLQRIADGGDFVAEADPIVTLFLDGGRA